MDIDLSKKQRVELERLNQSLEDLKKIVEDSPKFDYDRKYDLLLRSESEWSGVKDKATGKRRDLSLQFSDFEGSDVEVIDQINENSARAQIRRKIISDEKIRAIRNTARWRKLYLAVRSLETEFTGFWVTTDEIKKQRSTEIRNSEVRKRIRPVLELSDRIEAQFREGRHRDSGETMSFEQAANEAINNLDAARDTLKARRFGTIRERD
jgi:hypothetical protein